MARKYEFRPGYYGWAMERCEEQVLIVAFSEIEQRIPPGQAWKGEFLDNFYNSGLGVTFDTLAHINAERDRQNLERVEFIETNVYQYARSRDRLHKAELRRQLRDEFLSLDTTDQIRWKIDAANQKANLPAPHHTYAEVKAWQKTRSEQPDKCTLTPEERIRRMQAVERPVISGRSQPEAVCRASRQLRLARKAETIEKIIAELTPNDALVVAESGEIEDDEIIDALVLRSLGS